MLLLNRRKEGKTTNLETASLLGLVPAALWVCSLTQRRSLKHTGAPRQCIEEN